MTARRQTIPWSIRRAIHRAIVWRWAALGGALAILNACAIFRGHAASPEAQRGAAMAERLVGALGGGAAWKNIHFLHYVYSEREGARTVVRRTCFWDRATGRIRLEGLLNERPYTVLMNVKTGQGVAFENNDPARPERIAALLEGAAEEFTSDTFWLCGAPPLIERGAHPLDAGENAVEGRVCPTIAATFDPAVGRTASDVFYYYLDTRTGRPLALARAPQSAARVKPLTFLCREWTAVDGFQLAASLAQAGGPRTIEFSDVYTRDSVSDRVFMRF